MEFQRSSGVLLHITSLPSAGGIGDLGPAAHQFLEFLAAAKQHIWQVLPLCPTGYGNSPYAGTSAFAGNPFLVSLEFLSDWGWIDPERIAHQGGRSGAVNFEEIEWRKVKLLYEAAGNFLDRGPTDPKLALQWAHYREVLPRRGELAGRLRPLRRVAPPVLHRRLEVWPEPLRRREPQALAHAAATHARRVAEEQVLQFAFSLQWNELREAAAEKGIRILGDVAIFVNMDSADRLGPSGALRAGRGTATDPRRRRAARLFFHNRPALGQPALSLGCCWPSAASTGGSSGFAAPASSVRHRPPRPLPRLRGLLGDSRRRGDGGQRRVDQGARPRALPRPGGGARAVAAGGRGSGRDHSRSGRAARGSLACRE